MAPPTQVSITYNTVVLQWNVVTSTASNGGSPVTEYILQWDNYQYNNYYPSNLANLPWVTIDTVAQDTTVTQLSYSHV